MTDILGSTGKGSWIVLDKVEPVADPLTSRLLERAIKSVRAEIFKLVKDAPDLEAMHWYISLDDCFENNEFDPDNFGNIQWRCFVLQSKGLPVDHLLNLITSVLRLAGLIDVSGKPVK